MTEISTAVILAGGKGKRMNSDIPKQYMDLMGKPVLYYSIAAFEGSFIDDIILVAGKDYIEYCKTEIVDKYGFKKVRAIIEGGKERYDSVYNALKYIEGHNHAAIKKTRDYVVDKENNHNDIIVRYIYVHDGARACIDDSVLNECNESVHVYGNSVPAVPVKDTIKIMDEGGFVKSTPDRNSLYAVQTPQVFEYTGLKKAYDDMYEQLKHDPCGINITDDAMVMETFGNLKIRLSKGCDENIKITTKADFTVAESVLKKRLKKV